MKERFELSVSFWTEGCETAADISKQMGLLPTVAWNKGDPDPRPYLPDYRNENSYWELASPAPGESTIDAHFAALLDLLEPRQETVLELGRKYECGITCLSYFPDTCPSFCLGADILRRCGELNLQIKFELFCTDDESVFMKFVNRHLDLAAFSTVETFDDEPITF